MQSGSGAGTELAPKVLNQVLKQLGQLRDGKLEGIKYIPNDDDPLDIQADLEGPQQTPYEGGVFRVKLTMGSDFPSLPPKAFMLTKIFHPNISPSGEVCVNTLKRDWQPTAWSVSHIFQVIRCLLIVPFAESALNEEAGRLFMESYEEYASHARMVTAVHAPRAGAREALGERNQSDVAKKPEKAKARKTLKRL